MLCGTAAEDRAERRRKLGLPEQMTPQEEAAQRAKQAEKEAAKKRPPIVSLKSHSHSDKLRDALVSMKQEAGGSDDKWRTAFQTLFKYVSNIAQVSPCYLWSKQPGMRNVCAVLACHRSWLARKCLEQKVHHLALSKNWRVRKSETCTHCCILLAAKHSGIINHCVMAMSCNDKVGSACSFRGRKSIDASTAKMLRSRAEWPLCPPA